MKENLPIQQRPSTKALVFGISQSGKSTFALWLCLQIGKQLIIWDANEVFVALVKNPCCTPQDLQEAIEKKEPVIVYDASGYEDKHEHFKEFANVVERYDGHTLLIDESGDVQRAIDPNSGLDRLLRRAGRRRNDIVETTHRPTDLATLNRNLTTDVFLFFMWNRKGLQNVANEFGDEVAEAESQLDPDGFQFIQLDPHTGRFQVVDNPEAWFIDLEKPISEKRRVRLPERNPNLWNEAPYGIQ